MPRAFFIMAKDTFYFSHDYNSRNDEKIKFLIRKHGITGYGLFWAIIEDLYNNANALRTDYDCIAHDLKVDCELVKSVIEDFNLFEINGDIFSSKDFDLEKMTIKELKQAVSPSKINPRTDFYSYINERWINKEELGEDQKYIVQIDNFRLVQDKVYRELLELVSEYTKHNNNKLSREIKNFYKSQIKLNTDKQLSNYSNKILNEIDEIRKNGTVWDLLGFVNNNEIVSWGSPFSWSLNPDDKNPSIFRCYIDQPQLSLIDINIYFDDGTDVNYKKKYKWIRKHYILFYHLV